MTVLYHYTDEAGMKGIYSKGMIESSGSSGIDGPGVYFTEMKPPPVNSAESIALNNYGQFLSTVDRVRRWFKFQLKELPRGTVKLTNVGDRNIWKCPVDVPVKGRQRRVLYHYTDKKGKDGILASGIIKAVRPHGGQGIGAAMPIAVYFTGLPPSAVKEDLLFNMYGTRDTTKQDLMEKTKFWFKFYEEDIPNVEKRKTLKNRNEWICREDVPIHLSKCPGSMAGRGHWPPLPSHKAPSSISPRLPPTGKVHGSGGQKSGTPAVNVLPSRAPSLNTPRTLPTGNGQGSGVGGQKSGTPAANVFPSMAPNLSNRRTLPTGNGHGSGVGGQRSGTPAVNGFPSMVPSPSTPLLSQPVPGTRISTIPIYTPVDPKPSTNVQQPCCLARLFSCIFGCCF